MTIGDRIKLIRNHLKLTQSEFALRLKSVQNTITGYETGRRNPSNQVIELICREFNVNENWLLSGEGTMFIEFPEEDEYFRAATEISKANDELAMQVVIEYWKMDPEGKKLLKDFILNISKNIKKEE